MLNNLTPSNIILVKNITISFISNISQKILGFVSIYFIVRWLSQEQFGQYQFILSVIGLVSIFSLPGLSNAVMQSTARGMKGTLRLALKPVLLFGFLASLILITVSIYQFYSGDRNTAILFILSAIFYPFAYNLTLWRSLKSGEEKFSYIFKNDILFSSISTICIILSSFFFRGEVIILLFIILIVPTIQNITSTFFSLKSLGQNSMSEKESINYGLKTTIYSSFNIVANHIDKVLIYNFFSPSDLAIYFASERMSEITKSISQNIASVLGPKFAKHTTYSKKLDKNLNFLSIIVGVFIVCVAFLLLPWFMVILFGNEYREAIPYAQGLLCSVAIGNHATLRNRFVNSHLDKKSNRDVNISMSIIRILSSIILVPIFGLIGAVISTLIYRISTVIIMNYIIKRYRTNNH